MIDLLRAQFRDVLAIVAGCDFVVSGGHGQIGQVTYRAVVDPAEVKIEIIKVAL